MATFAFCAFLSLIKNNLRSVADHKHVVIIPLTSPQLQHASLCQLMVATPQLVSVADPYTGYTALHWAAKVETIEILTIEVGDCYFPSA